MIWIKSVMKRGRNGLALAARCDNSESTNSLPTE